MKWLWLLILMIPFGVMSQDEVAMADAMRESGKIYVVIGVLVLIFLGLTFYLISIDLRVDKLEKELKS